MSNQELPGTVVPLSGKLYEMLCGVFNKSEAECTIPIRFRMSEEGKQTNQVRSDLTSVLSEPTLESGMVLAQRLGSATPNISGVGLLFIIVASTDEGACAVVSRFPAEQGVMAEQGQGPLQVAFVEQIFMKSAKSYKAARYFDTSLHGGFWSGTSVDRQINSPHDSLANYWIKDFLNSELMTTSKAGTKRMALALKEAVRLAPNMDAQQELISAIVLASGLTGRTTSIERMAKQFSLSAAATDALFSQVDNPMLISDTFVLDKSEFVKFAHYRVVRLNNDVTLSAPAETFDQSIDRELVNSNDHIVRYSTVGKVVEERIRNRN